MVSVSDVDLEDRALMHQLFAQGAGALVEVAVVRDARCRRRRDRRRAAGCCGRRSRRSWNRRLWPTAKPPFELGAVAAVLAEDIADEADMALWDKLAFSDTEIGARPLPRLRCCSACRPRVVSGPASSRMNTLNTPHSSCR